MSEVVPDDRFMLTHLVAGKRVGFAAIQGEVVGIERWTETQTSSAPGSVHVHDNQVDAAVADYLAGVNAACDQVFAASK